MKTILFLILLFSLNSIEGQTTFIEFQITDYDNDEIQHTEIRKVKSLNDTLNLKFYQENHMIPFTIPDKLTDENYIKVSDTVWNNDKDKLNHFNNWSYIYIFDSLSRIVSYSFSGCMICAMAPWTVEFVYNQNGQLIKLKSNFMQTMDLKYDVNENIIELKKYSSDELKQKIELIK